MPKFILNLFKPNYEPPPPSLLRGIITSLCAYFCFITASTIVWNMSGNISTIQIVFMQNAVGLLLILPISLRKGMQRLATPVPSDHFIRDLFGIGSYYLYFLAIRYLNLVDATTLNYVAPFFVPFVWWIWMKQRVNIHVWWSIVIGFIGVAIMLNPSRQIFELGFVFGLFAGISAAIALCAVRVLNLKREPMSRTLFYFFSFGSIVSLPFAWATWASPTFGQWIMMCAIGLATGLGQILLTISYRYGTATYLSPLGYSTVVYAALISWFMFDRPLTFRSLIGTSLIILGGMISYRLKPKA